MAAYDPTVALGDQVQALLTDADLAVVGFVVLVKLGDEVVVESRSKISAARFWRLIRETAADR